MPQARRIMLSGMPNRLAVFGRAFEIAHHQRLLDQRFDAAQARADAAESLRHRPREPSPPIGVVHQKRHQAAEAAHRPPRDFVIRMRSAGPG